MLARAATRTSTTVQTAAVARRAFTTTRARLSSPYHYPEGPLSNLPFNPRKKGFAVMYWGYMVVGFGAPFGIACAFSSAAILSRSWGKRFGLDWIVCADVGCSGGV